MPKRSILRNILQAHFRANPGYELVVFDRLPEAYRQTLHGLQQDPDFYGVLWPRQPQGLSLKAACQDTALLFFTLQEPGPIPAYVRAEFGEQCNQAVAELVLDGVLEMAWDKEGDFVSGAEAYELIYEERLPPLGGGRVAQLSQEALQYAQALAIENSSQLSARLYFYNTVPVSPAWRRRLPTPEAVAAYLGIQAAGPNRRLLDQHWVLVPSSDDTDGWLTWRSRRAQQEVSGRELRLGFKLYVSPLPEALPEVWRAIIEIFAAFRVTTFKTGSDVYGLLRPDKIVAYCAHFEEIAAVAARLQEKLAGCPAQGVPFTAGIDATGLLSWGMDPPREMQVLGWQVRESWRLWVTNQLAVALLAAKSVVAQVPPWQFALERLHLEGVDIETWTPRQAMWQQERGV